MPIGKQGGLTTTDKEFIHSELAAIREEMAQLRIVVAQSALLVSSAISGDDTHKNEAEVSAMLERAKVTVKSIGKSRSSSPSV